MRTYLSERNIVIVLFVMVVITFSFAQEDCKKIEQLYLGTSSASAAPAKFVKADNPVKLDQKDVDLPVSFQE